MIETAIPINEQTRDPMPEPHPGTPGGGRIVHEFEILAASGRSLKIRLPGGVRETFIVKSIVTVVGGSAIYGHGATQQISMPVWLYRKLREELL